MIGSATELVSLQNPFKWSRLRNDIARKTDVNNIRNKK